MCMFNVQTEKKKERNISEKEIAGTCVSHLDHLESGEWRYLVSY